jgi:large subunit ribosomal protein L13e
VVFPRKAGKPKAGDSKEVDLSSTKTASIVSAALPIVPVSQGISEIKKSDMPKAIEGGAYTKLRMARSNKRQQGQREKRAREAAEAEANKK